MNDMCNNCICLNVDCKGSQETVWTGCVSKKTATINTTTNIEELKKKIEEQEQENIRLFELIPIASHEDPRNEKAEPILKQWREGSTKIKSLLNELYQLEMKERDERIANGKNIKEIKTFVNGFGEATNKYITSSTYERAENRRLKEVLSFMGSR